MTQERFDVVIRVLSGPLSTLGEQVFQGPVVRIGSNPGPGGCKLPGYRGVDARQCVITAYGKGEATIGPVGSNQVRVAPHPHVNWDDIDPISGPEYASKGCAIHLGPVGRGCTVQFVECRRLGQWTQGRLGSEAASVGSKGVSAPALPMARRTETTEQTARRLIVQTLPVWFFGCLTLMTSATIAFVIAFVILRGTVVPPPGPTIEGAEYYDFAQLSDRTMSEEALEGLKEPFRKFVTAPSKEQAQNLGAVDVAGITNPETWDQQLFDYTTASFEKHLRAKVFFKKLNAVRDNYSTVLTELREANLPEVFAAIPYLESRYQPNATSVVCAKGYWQFMPELAHRLHIKNGLDFQVKDCTINRDDGSSFAWSPKQFAPPRGLVRGGTYVSLNAAGEPQCAIKKCAKDDRTNLVKSTRAAIFSLGEAWNDPGLAQSGAGVAIAILSHNAGYDDGRYGIKKKTNLKFAYADWRRANPSAPSHAFYGANITCASPHQKTFCGSVLPPETQHYAYNIIAQHLLAVCYYGRNYRDEFEAFQQWDSLLGEDGYCQQFRIPLKDAL